MVSTSQSYDIFTSIGYPFRDIHVWFFMIWFKETYMENLVEFFEFWWQLKLYTTLPTYPTMWNGPSYLWIRLLWSPLYFYWVYILTNTRSPTLNSVGIHFLSIHFFMCFANLCKYDFVMCACSCPLVKQLACSQNELNSMIYFPLWGQFLRSFWGHYILEFFFNTLHTSYKMRLIACFVHEFWVQPQR